MPIPVACQCGQRFQAKDELAGRAVKCPKCQQPLRIPMPQPMATPQQGLSPGMGRQAAAGPGPLDDLFDEVGLEASASGMRCMQCGAAMPAGGFLCVHCGFNHQTGERVEGSSDARAMSLSESYGNPILDQAARNIEFQQAESKKSNDLIPWWGYLIGLLLLGTFVGGMLMLPAEVAFGVSGFMLVGIGVLASVVGSIWVIVVAFNDSVGQGVMVLLIPFYFIIYSFMHWDECGFPFMLWAGGQVASTIASLVLTLLVPMLAEDDNSVWLPPVSPPAVVASFDPCATAA